MNTPTMPETFSIQLTSDEVNMVAYALKEMGCKLALDAMNSQESLPMPVSAGEHLNLAEKIYQTLSQ